MARLGEIAEVVSAHKTSLEVGSDKYEQLQDLKVHIEVTEERDIDTSGATVYSVGGSDNWFSCTLSLTGPELDGTSYSNSTTAASFNNLTQSNTDGTMDEIDWKIVAEDEAGNSKTLTCTGYLRLYEIEKPRIGFTEVFIWVRITEDTITIA